MTLIWQNFIRNSEMKITDYTESRDTEDVKKEKWLIKQKRGACLAIL
jgi:hypothetical protein